MLYLAWTAVFFAMAAFLAISFKQRMENCLAPAFFAAVLLLYLFGAVGLLKPALYAVALLGAASAGGVLLACIQGKTLYRQYWLTPGMLAAVLAVFYIAWMQSGRVVMGNDEFSHWAYTVKMMVHHDSFSVAHAEEMIFPTYPPALSLLEYLFVRFTPEFTESYLYRGLNLLQVSLLVPFLSRFGWKKWTGALLGFAALFLLPLAFYEEFYTDLCVDGTLALLTAYYLYAWFGRRKRDAFAFLSISLAGAVLVLTKESGLIFALWGLGIILWDSFNRGQLLLKKLPLKQKLMPQRGWGIVLASILAAKLSWSAVLAANGQEGSSGHLVQNLLSLAGPWSDRTTVTVGAFFRKMLLYPEMDAPLRLSPVMWLVAGAALLGLAAACVPEKRNALRRLRAGLVAGFAVYALGLLYLYLFSFGEYEGTRVFSFWRYLGSWVLAMALLGVGLLLEQAARAENHLSELPVLLLAAVLLVFPFNTKQVNNLVSPATQIVQDQALRNAYPSAAWFENGLTPEDRVYFVADDTAVYEKLCAAYSLYPYRCDSTAGYNFDTTGNNAMYANEVTAEEWAAALKEDGYTYVYLYAISEHFLEEYITLFEEPSDVAARALFRVEAAGDGVTLVRAN